MEVLNIILTVLPAAIAVITEVGVVGIVKGVINACIKKINDNSEFVEVKKLMSTVVQENYELKKQINELLTKIDNIKR